MNIATYRTEKCLEEILRLGAVSVLSTHYLYKLNVLVFHASQPENGVDAVRLRHPFWRMTPRKKEKRRRTRVREVSGLARAISGGRCGAGAEIGRPAASSAAVLTRGPD